MSRKERERWERQLRADKELYELVKQARAERERERKELALWTKRKNELIKGKTCVNCGKPANTMHHPKLRKEYGSSEEYLNEPNLMPVCNWCHYTVFHGGNPYHMRWKYCQYRGNREIRVLPEYRQKQVIFKNFCNQCQKKDKCLAVPIVTF